MGAAKIRPANARPSPRRSAVAASAMSDGRFRIRACPGIRSAKQIEDAGGEAAWKAVSRRGRRDAQRPVVHPRAWGFGVGHLQLREPFLGRRGLRVEASRDPAGVAGVEEMLLLGDLYAEQNLATEAVARVNREEQPHQRDRVRSTRG